MEFISMLMDIWACIRWEICNNAALQTMYQISYQDSFLSHRSAGQLGGYEFKIWVSLGFPCLLSQDLCSHTTVWLSYGAGSECKQNSTSQYKASGHSVVLDVHSRFLFLRLRKSWSSPKSEVETYNLSSVNNDKVWEGRQITTYATIYHGEVLWGWNN